MNVNAMSCDVTLYACPVAGQFQLSDALNSPGLSRLTMSASRDTKDPNSS